MSRFKKRSKNDISQMQLILGTGGNTLQSHSTHLLTSSSYNHAVTSSNTPPPPTILHQGLVARIACRENWPWWENWPAPAPTRVVSDRCCVRVNLRRFFASLCYESLGLTGGPACSIPGESKTRGPINGVVRNSGSREVS